MKELKSRGHDPCLRDTLRTAEEALANAKKGTGIVDSMHLYGVAADIICNKHGWSCRSKKCNFFETLLQVVELAGCYSGARWGDQPHFQAIPASKLVQDRMRAFGTKDSTSKDRDAMCLKYLKLNLLKE